MQIVRGSPGRVFGRVSAPPAHFVRRLRARWLTHAARFWWGDAVDSRFLLTWEASTLQGCSVLDIGCNAGVILSEVPDTNLKVGIDINPEALEVALSLSPSASFFRGDMLRLPYRDAVFEVVIFAGMLEISDRQDKVGAIQEVHRVLKPDGRLLLTTPNRAYPRYRRHNGVVTYDELVSIVGPYFEMEAKGFNPFPPFPQFLPNRLLARIPGIWHLLTALMTWDALSPRCCSFYVRGIKKDIRLPSQPIVQLASGHTEEPMSTGQNRPNV